MLAEKVIHDLKVLELLLKKYAPIHASAATRLQREIEQVRLLVQAGHCWRCRGTHEVTVSKDGLTIAGFEPCPVCNKDGSKPRPSKKYSLRKSGPVPTTADKAGVPVKRVNAVGTFLEQKKK